MVPNLSFNPIKNKRAAKRMPEGWDGFRQGEMMRKAIVLACAVIICALPGYGDSNYGSPANPQAWEWRPVAVFGGLPIWFSAAFTIGDKAFVGTGYGAENEFWQYDAGLDEWTQKANFPGKPRGAAVAFSIGGKGYVGLGFADEARFSDLWEFDPSANRWTWAG
jgi:hypothetical protein